eukprot:COSAG06_NODE_46299_length_348_cov_0.566265_1_plen_33_part_01
MDALSGNVFVVFQQLLAPQRSHLCDEIVCNEAA